MGLRDYLMSLQSAQESTGQFAKTAEAMRQRAGKEAFAAELPGLIQGGDINAIAQKGMQYGDNTVMEQLTKQMIAQQTGTAKKQFTPEALKGLGMSEADIKNVESIPAAQQSDYIGKWQAKNQFGLKQQQEERATEETARRSRQTVANQFKETFAKSRDQLMDEERKIKGIEKVKDFNTLAGNRPILNFVARSIGDEKGPLAESDIAGFIPKTFLGDVQKFKNYILGTPEQDWPKDVKESMVQVVNFARENFDAYKDRKVGFLLSDSLTNPDLQDQDGAPIERVQNLAKEFGFKYDKEKDSFSKVGPKKELAGDDALIAQLPENMREQAKTALSATKDPAKLERIRANIEKNIKR